MSHDKSNSFPESFPDEGRGEEIIAIINKVPSWLTRWGISMVFLFLLIILVFAWFIKYPDVISAEVIITSKPQPEMLVTRTQGRIIQLLKEGDKVKEGSIIGHIKTAVNLSAVLDLEKTVLTDHLSYNKTATFGELENIYSKYLSTLNELDIFRNTRTLDLQISELKRQRYTYERMGDLMNSQTQLANKQLGLAKIKYLTDSILHYQKVTSDIEYNQAELTWLQNMEAIKDKELLLLNNQLQVDQLDKQIKDLELQKTERQQMLTLEVDNARKELLSAIHLWKQTYLITSSENGYVAWLDGLEDGQFVQSGITIASVIPESGILIAKAKIPVKGSGKVKIGQRVNILLDNYPYEQFGTIPGKITSISPFPSEGKYYTTIALTEGLNTSLSQTLPFKQQLSGTTEIITENLRLSERIFYQFRKLIKKN